MDYFCPINCDSQSLTSIVQIIFAINIFLNVSETFVVDETRKLMQRYRFPVARMDYREKID